MTLVSSQAPSADPLTCPLYYSDDEGATTEAVEEGKVRKGLKERPVTVALSLPVAVIQLGFPAPLPTRAKIGRKVESIIRYKFPNLMVK